jgi:uncharacterized membrane protein
MNPSPLRLLLFIAAAAFVVGIVQIGLVSIAFDKLGIAPESAYLLLAGTLLGSMINLPLFTLDADPTAPPPIIPPELARLKFLRMPPFNGKILVTMNVGGALVPLVFSLYLVAHSTLNVFHVVAAVGVVAIIAGKLSWPIPGVGIGMPVFVAPIAAAVIASVLDPEQRAPLAYIGGTLGVLIGADLIHLAEIRRLGSPFASIGGGGTLDGVFLTGLVAVLLA